MNVLVTGGCGFLGSHLCEVLINKGHRVICMDNLITGKKENVDGMNLEFIKHDIRDPFDVPCEMTFNMACPASPIDYQNVPIETMETCSNGMKNILENAKKYKARIIHASTSEVYGDPLEHPQKEGYFGNVNTLGPRSCYDEGKRYAEALCYNYNKLYKMEIVLIRIFNTYGPNMRIDDGRVIPNFITQALNNKEITIYGNGNQTRSFCYVNDLIDGIIKIGFSDVKFDVFNLGNPDEHTMIELAKKIKEIAGSESEIKFKELPKDDPQKRNPDITKIKTLGWKPKIKLDEGLKKTIEWFKERRDV